MENWGKKRFFSCYLCLNVMQKYTEKNVDEILYHHFFMYIWTAYVSEQLQ